MHKNSTKTFKRLFLLNHAPAVLDLYTNFVAVEYIRNPQHVPLSEPEHQVMHKHQSSSKLRD